MEASNRTLLENRVRESSPVGVRKQPTRRQPVRPFVVTDTAVSPYH